MNLDELIAEGRRLARPCVSLRDTGVGPVVAQWYLKDEAPLEEIDRTGELCWLTVDLSHVPNLPAPLAAQRFLTVYTNEKDGETGRVELSSELPAQASNKSQFIPLFAETSTPLPPIDAVFTLGSDAVRGWLHENDWPLREPYTPNFKDHNLAEPYERLSKAETPAYSSPEVYAVLGGWHMMIGYDDWHEKIDRTLVVCTLADAEPWVEVWHDASGNYSVIQRIS